jgi:hypothetical protein
MCYLKNVIMAAEILEQAEQRSVVQEKEGTAPGKLRFKNL